jgi:hypothetical protein
LGRLVMQAKWGDFVEHDRDGRIDFCLSR